MGKFSPDHDEQTEMEIGPNRCAVDKKTTKEKRGK